MTKSSILLLLTLAAAAQLAALHRRSHALSLPIQRNHEFPLLVRAVHDSTSLLEGKGCILVVICRINCQYCNGLAAARPIEGGDTTNIDIVWAVVGQDAAQEFAETHNFVGDELGFIDLSNPRGFSLHRRRVALPGTPLRVLLDSKHRVADVALGQGLPDKEAVDRACK